MTSKREQLASMTTLVADTGDLAAIRATRPQDATTNPSLMLAVANSPEAAGYWQAARELVPAQADAAQWMDAFGVVTGREILAAVPGYVSTEVDARLSFDTVATLNRARKIVALYRRAGVDASRVLIKIAATWEGIQAARILETEGIKTNLTLVFGLPQALAAADAGAFLISPFVGRIYDWYKKLGQAVDSPQTDPGVLSVKAIHQALKARGSQTIIMGASFRHAWQVEALAGCDRLTVSPALLSALEQDQGALPRALLSVPVSEAPQVLAETDFRWQLNADVMAESLLADGIRRFAQDQLAMEQQVPGR